MNKHALQRILASEGLLSKKAGRKYDFPRSAVKYNEAAKDIKRLVKKIQTTGYTLSSGTEVPGQPLAYSVVLGRDKGPIKGRAVVLDTVQRPDSIRHYLATAFKRAGWDVWYDGEVFAKPDEALWVDTDQRDWRGDGFALVVRAMPGIGNFAPEP
jgi:hypothetical protein